MTNYDVKRVSKKRRTFENQKYGCQKNFFQRKNIALTAPYVWNITKTAVSALFSNHLEVCYSNVTCWLSFHWLSYLKLQIPLPYIYLCIYL